MGVPGVNCGQQCRTAPPPTGRGSDPHGAAREGQGLTGSAVSPHPHGSEPWGADAGKRRRHPGTRADARAERGGHWACFPFRPFPSSFRAPSPLHALLQDAGNRNSGAQAPPSSSPSPASSPTRLRAAPGKASHRPREGQQEPDQQPPQDDRAALDPSPRGALPSNPEQEERYVPRVTDTAGQVTTTLRASVSTSVSSG